MCTEVHRAPPIKSGEILVGELDVFPLLHAHEEYLVKVRDYVSCTYAQQQINALHFSLLGQLFQVCSPYSKSKRSAGVD